MSQTFNIPVASGVKLSEARETHNDALLTLQSNFSGTEEPAAPVRGQLWHDETAKMLKVRNYANTAWLDVISTDGP